MFGIPQKHMKKAMESRKRNQIILTTLRETDGSPQTQRDRTKHAHLLEACSARAPMKRPPAHYESCFSWKSKGFWGFLYAPATKKEPEGSFLAMPAKAGPQGG